MAAPWEKYIYIAFMMARGKTKESSCNENYRGNRQYSKENLSLFIFCQQSFHMNKPGMETRLPFAMKLRSLNRQIRLFYTIKHIWYFTFFLLWDSGSILKCPSTAPDGNTSTYKTVNIFQQPLWSLFIPHDQSYRFQSLQDPDGYVCSLSFTIKLQTFVRLTYYS
jgi:hypothetical protein